MQYRRKEKEKEKNEKKKTIYVKRMERYLGIHSAGIYSFFFKALIPRILISVS